MKRKLRFLFWVESVLAAFTAILAFLSIVSRDWIEKLSGFDPDADSGVFEWQLVAFLSVVTVLLAYLARREWYRESRFALSADSQ